MTCFLAVGSAGSVEDLAARAALGPLFELLLKHGHLLPFMSLVHAAASVPAPALV